MKMYRDHKRGGRSHTFHSLRLKKSERTIGDFAKGDQVEIRMKEELRGSPAGSAGKVYAGIVVSHNALMVKIKFTNAHYPSKYFSPYLCFKPGDK